jgi:hypothetical protein
MAKPNEIVMLSYNETIGDDFWGKSYNPVSGKLFSQLNAFKKLPTLEKN